MLDKRQNDFSNKGSVNRLNKSGLVYSTMVLAYLILIFTSKQSYKELRQLLASLLYVTSVESNLTRTGRIYGLVVYCIDWTYDPAFCAHFWTDLLFPKSCIIFHLSW